MKWPVLVCVFVVCGSMGACHSSETAEPAAKPSGAYTEADVGAANVVEAAHVAIEAIQGASPSIQQLSLKRIVRAESQVVAGTNFRLRLELDVDGTTEMHDVVVFVQPWTDPRKVTSDTIVR
jgi:hypothetical protein